MADLGIRVYVNLENDSLEDVEKLFYEVMETVGDLGYSIVLGSLDCERFFDVNDMNMPKQRRKFKEIYEVAKAREKERFETKNGSEIVKI